MAVADPRQAGSDSASTAAALAETADTPLTPEEQERLGQALMFDPASLVARPPARPLRLPSFNTGGRLAVTRTEQPDGSATATIKQPLSTEWNAAVGADLGVAASPAPTAIDRPEALARDTGRNTGAAWASVGIANIATVNARVDPAADQGVLGTTLQRSIPVGGNLSVTLSNTSTVTRSFDTTPASEPTSLPVMTLAPPGSTPAQVWGDTQAVTFNYHPTGTTFAAGVATVSSDPMTHNTLSADQKLYGPLHVTTAVTDVGEPTSSKSITAGFKLNW